MPAPVDVELSGSSGPPAGLAVSGITGTHTALNVTYDYGLSAAAATVEYNARSGTGTIEETGAEEWGIFAGGESQFSGEGKWPHLVTTWTPANDGAGTPVAVVVGGRAVAFTPDESPATVQATLTTALTGSNNDLLFTAEPLGRLGNDITVRYRDPAANNAALSVSVTGRAITVNLATGAGGAITSTAAQIGSAIEASEAAFLLVAPNNAAGNNGSGVVTAMAATALTGGTGGLPPAPVAVVP